MSDLTYSNPRLVAVVEDYPYGGNQRTTATFVVTTDPKRGQRAERTTIDPKTGHTSKPKALTFGRRVRLVDGSDGRTYILSLVPAGSHLRVMQSNMQTQEESLFPGHDRFDATLALLAL